VALPLDIGKQLDALLAGSAFAVEPGQHHAALLALLREELTHAASCNVQLHNYFRGWPIDYREAEAIADLPYLPVGVFKANPPLSLVTRDQITKTLASSATTGQTPSRVVLDAETSKRMTKGVMAIIRSFIGPARRPYLVVDVPESLTGLAELGARSAAIQGLRPFSSEIVCCLRKDEAGELASTKRDCSSSSGDRRRPTSSSTALHTSCGINSSSRCAHAAFASTCPTFGCCTAAAGSDWRLRRSRAPHSRKGSPLSSAAPNHESSISMEWSKTSAWSIPIAHTETSMSRHSLR